MPRQGFEFWDQLCALQPYSFFLRKGVISRHPDSVGNWIERSGAQKIMDEAQCHINQLKQEKKTALGLLDEVASVFTRHDGLPNNLLPRIDAFLAENNKPEKPEGA